MPGVSRADCVCSQALHTPRHLSSCHFNQMQNGDADKTGRCEDPLHQRVRRLDGPPARRAVAATKQALLLQWGGTPCSRRCSVKDAAGACAAPGPIRPTGSSDGCREPASDRPCEPPVRELLRCWLSHVTERMWTERTQIPIHGRGRKGHWLACARSRRL